MQTTSVFSVNYHLKREEYALKLLGLFSMDKTALLLTLIINQIY